MGTNIKIMASNWINLVGILFVVYIYVTINLFLRNSNPLYVVMLLTFMNLFLYGSFL